MAKLTNKQILRGIIKELSHISNGKPAQSQLIYPFVVDQFKRYDVTERKVCRGENETRHLGETYHCLLESVRRCQEITDLYKGSGEKTPEEAANSVGLNLPQQPEPTN